MDLVICTKLDYNAALADGQRCPRLHATHVRAAISFILLSLKYAKKCVKIFPDYVKLVSFV